MAAASDDPATAGVVAFDVGIGSETFIGHYTVNGRTWSRPLRSMGPPGGIAKTPDGDLIVVGGFLPDLSDVRHGHFSSQLLIMRVTVSGDLVYEKKIETEAEALASAIAIASDGSIYLGGGMDPNDPEMGTTAYAFLVKCDSTGTKLWEKRISSKSVHALATAIAAMPNGDVLVTGGFDGTHATCCEDFDGEHRPNTVLARFSPDGEEIWSRQAGMGALIPVGSNLAVLPNGDFLLAGTTIEVLDLGGLLVDRADRPWPTGAAAFVSFFARFDGDGEALWVTTDEHSYWPAGFAVNGDGTGFIGLVPEFNPPPERAFLRAFDISTGSLLHALEATGEGDGRVAPRSISYGGGVFVLPMDFGAQSFVDLPPPAFLTYVPDEPR